MAITNKVNAIRRTESQREITQNNFLKRSLKGNFLFMMNASK